jgi:hypothetical protein
MRVGWSRVGRFDVVSSRGRAWTESSPSRCRLAMIRTGGRLLTITYPVPKQEWIGRDDVALHFVLDMEALSGGMREVGDLAVRGELRATIGRRYTLDEGAQACVDFVRLHTTGKLVVTM